MDAENREDERKEFSADVVLEFASGEYQARISDISLGGCYVDAIASVAEGEPISITITLSREKSQRYHGKVAYVLPGFGFGMCFSDLNEENTDFLQQILS